MRLAASSNFYAGWRMGVFAWGGKRGGSVRLRGEMKIMKDGGDMDGLMIWHDMSDNCAMIIERTS